MKEGHPKDNFCGDWKCSYCGGYFAGLVDGEGCMMLTMRERNGRIKYEACFVIQLRMDDYDVLFKLKKHLRCGTLRSYDKLIREGRNDKPVARIMVTKTEHLMRIISILDRFPMQAKKKRDFEIWKEAIKLKAHVMSRGCGGCKARWSSADQELYKEYHDALRAIRKYEDPSGVRKQVKIPKAPKSKQPSLGIFKAID